MNTWWFLWPLLAMVAALLALGPLGVHVLRRGVVFIDLAIAQSAAAGALVALSLGHHPAWWITQSTAFLGALLAAGAVAFLASRWPQQREALIGLIYVASATIALLTARLDAHGGDHLHGLLAADVLWAEPTQVAALGVCALAVLIMRAHLHLDRWFYPLFALVASIAVQALGLFVVFAALIAPALWQSRRRWGLASALTLCGLSCGVGLVLSWMLDAPSGPLIALGLAITGVVSAWPAGIIDRQPPLPSGQPVGSSVNRHPEHHRD